jgi:hypothetical protein
MASQYVSGQQVRLKATFTNAAGEPAEPTTVKFKVKNGEGAVTNYEAPTKDATGVFHQDITITEAAGGTACTWYYRAEGAGAVVAAGETFFTVAQSQF